MGGKFSRDKGAKYEREIAIKLRPIWSQACRGDPKKKQQPKECDIENTPYRIEAKHKKAQPNALAALRQAEADARVVTDERTYRADMRPLVAITKKTHGAELATMYLSDWVELVAELEELRRKQ